MAVILNSAILDSAILQNSDSNSLTLAKISSHYISTKKTSLIHSDSTWWWQPSWILPSWIQPFLHKKNFGFILTQLVDGSHLEFCHVGFRHCHLGFKHLVIFSEIHSKTFSLHSDSVKLIQSDLTWWWQPSWILHIEFCHLGFSHFAKKLWLKLSFILTQWWQPSWVANLILHKKNFIHSDSTWWWQPSWILPCWIQTLPSWIQMTLLSSLRFTQKQLFLWLWLIQSDSN